MFFQLFSFLFRKIQILGAWKMSNNYSRETYEHSDVDDEDYEVEEEEVEDDEDYEVDEEELADDDDYEDDFDSEDDEVWYNDISKMTTLVRWPHISEE